ncbi:MAG: VOC family protein [Deltaproteobacteria bacterium]|nr:VOC family protein [Deltaproteobacteria bacterium]
MTIHPMRVDHVSIAVRDIDAALARFRSLLPLAMNVEKRPGYTDDFNWCDCYIGNFKLELIEAARPGSFVHRFIDRRGEGLHHLSLETTQLPALAARLERDGLRIVDRWSGGENHMTAFISPRSAYGALVQFWHSPELAEPQRPRAAALRLRSGENIRMFVDHVSLAVRSIDTTLGFFRRYFPITLGPDKHPGYDGSFALTNFSLKGYKIELIEQLPGQPPGFVARFLAKRGEGFHHLSIDVERLDPLLAQLEAEGVRIVDRADLGQGYKTAFISPRSAHGVLIQFWETPIFDQLLEHAAGAGNHPSD